MKAGPGGGGGAGGRLGVPLTNLFSLRFGFLSVRTTQGVSGLLSRCQTSVLDGRVFPHQLQNRTDQVQISALRY